MKKTLKIVGISMLIVILFRGHFYRSLIQYKEIGTRKEIRIRDKSLIKKIQLEAANETMNMHNIVKIATKITTRELAFTSKKSSTDPNQLIHSKRTNCIGYSSMFNSIVLYLIEENNLERQIETKHNIGQLNLLGIDLHQFFKSPFFKDHDFNEIRDKSTGEAIFIDPSISDYLGIKRVKKI